MSNPSSKRTSSLVVILMFSCMALLLFGVASTTLAGGVTPPGNIVNPSSACNGADVLVSWDGATTVDLNWTGTTTGTYAIPDGLAGSHTIPGPGTFTIVIEDRVTSAPLYGPVVITCSSGGDSEGPVWDHRVNPHPAEYYSIYCAFDLISVYHGGTGALLRTMPINDVAHMTDGGPPMDVGNGMTVARNGDVVTFAGSNGFGPEPSSKWFTLTECRERNGEIPNGTGGTQGDVGPSLCTAGVWYCPDPDNPWREAWNWDCGWWWGHYFAGLVNVVPDLCQMVPVG